MSAGGDAGGRALTSTVATSSLAALAQSKGPAAPAVKTLEYREMELFFVAGDRDAL
jgi:hypothetical protein